VSAPNVYGSIGELFLAVLEGHLSAEQIGQLLANDVAILKNQALILEGQAAATGQLATLSTFLGASPGALSAADAEALAGVTKSTLDLTKLVGGISTQVPVKEST
jgi:hypothetical protein